MKLEASWDFLFNMFNKEEGVAAWQWPQRLTGAIINLVAWEVNLSGN